MAGQVVKELDHQVELRKPFYQVFFVGFVFF